jgi:formate C-acetyltransferase
LKKLGIPAARAEDWGIVGCYEASPQGDCYPLTVAGGFTLPELLWNFLQTRSSWKSFDSFYDGLKIYFNEIYLQKILPSFKQRWNDFCRNCPSPFESICVNGCIESGLAVEEGGAIFNLFGVNILGLGTLVDSLLSIKELIFEAEDLTFEQIKQQLNDNYPNQKLLLRCRNLPGKFGTNTSESNKLAHDISAFIANTVIKNPLPGCVRPYPGFFRFGQDINQKFMASADGRLADERISYGSGPGVFLDRADITSILNSAACVAHKSCACGNPLLISLNRKDASGIEGRQRIRHLVESYFRQGGFHLHFNITDAEYLENAKLNPDDYSELIVRISGFSANFVRLDALWQDAIIERTKSGM